MKARRQLLIGGRWVEGASTLAVLDKYQHTPIAEVTVASPAHVEAAVAAARQASTVVAGLPAHRRSAILLRVAALLEERKEAFAATISKEAGKGIKYARGEVARAVSTFTLASEEAKRIHGETVPLDAVAAGENHFGFWVRRPLGVVAAITPFNFPLNLVAHKVAPAIAAGNAVVLKPAEVAPLAAAMLCELLEEAGLPPGGINLVHGPGESVGAALVTAPGVAKVTFTGSRAVGETILSRAGIKKVTLELGNNAPVIVAEDADLEAAASRAALGAYYYSGQVCISVQRIYVDRAVAPAFEAMFVEAVGKLGVGDPASAGTDVGPMISEAEARRVQSWVEEAVAQGARTVCGGERTKAVMEPTLLVDTSDEMRVVAQEAFGPVCSLMPTDSFEESVRRAGTTEYGLQAAVFTQDIDRVLNAVEKLDFGGVVVNDTPSFRADHMPYGGNRQSGLGREGLRFAIEDMTNIQMVSIRRGG